MNEKPKNHFAQPMQRVSIHNGIAPDFLKDGVHPSPEARKLLEGINAAADMLAALNSIGTPMPVVDHDSIADAQRACLERYAKTSISQDRELKDVPSKSDNRTISTKQE